MPIREIRHPLIRHKIGLMRRADISTKNFRELAQEVGALLTYEATNDLPLEHYEIQGWAGPVQVAERGHDAARLLPDTAAQGLSAGPFRRARAGLAGVAEHSAQRRPGADPAVLGR